MFKKILSFLFKDFYLFTAAYSNNVFPDPLPKEEEERCIRELSNGSREARSKLIEHNLRLIAHIVKKYEHKVDEVDDLISIGTIGLIKGIDSYSGKKETTAALYITTYISADNGENINTFDNISLVDFLPYFRVDNSIKNITIKDEEKIVFETTKYTSISNAKGDYDQTAEIPEYYIDISFQTNPRL